MAEFCPTCSAPMRHIIIDSAGYVRPLTSGDRRHRGCSIDLPAWRCEAQEQVGKLDVNYRCDACDVTVVPGVTHLRRWDRPSEWMPAGQARLRAPDSATIKQGHHRDEVVRARYHREYYQQDLERKKVQRRDRDRKRKQARCSRRKALRASPLCGDIPDAQRSGDDNATG